MSNPKRDKAAQLRAENLTSSCASLPPELARRRFLIGGLLLALAPFSPRLMAASSPRRVRFLDYPFRLGVSSGTPGPHSMVLWTRLCPDPLHGGGMAEERIRLDWEVATDEQFGRIVRRGATQSAKELGHSAHVEVDGLEPDRVYWYRFSAGSEVSPTGRTRTLPAADADVSTFRFALTSCQHYEQGYFHGYRHALADDPKLMVFVGDSIYESSWGEDLVRTQLPGEPHSLDEYRNLHALYRSDRDLAAMHAQVPWLVTVDDHEIDNDWAGNISEHLDPQFAIRRAAALQAFFEHMPLPLGSLLDGAQLQLHRHIDIGRLARMYLLDTRQFRDRHVCSRDGMAGGGRVAPDACPERHTEQRSMLGRAQEQWLENVLDASQARWNIIAQQTLLGPLKVLDWGKPAVDVDGWDGYSAARQRLLNLVAKPHVANPIVTGGDVHATYAMDLKRDFDDAKSPVIAAEISGTSLTSSGYPQDVVDQFAALNPHLRFANSNDHGYLLFDIEKDKTMVQLRAVESIKEQNAGIRTLKEFGIEAGRPGLLPG